MPPLSKQMIRAAFLNLWLGFGFASLLMLWKGQPDLLPATVGAWILAHVDLLLVGWMVQLAMGVSYWIFPRLPQTLTLRGRYRYAYSAAFLLNLGVWGYTLAMVANWGAVQVLALLLQVVAVLAYGYHIAPRVRSAITKRG